MKFKYKSLVLLFIATLLSGCLNNISFDDVNLDVEPILNVPLVSLELDQLDFFDVDNSIEITTVADITDLEIFKSSTFQNDLLRIDFTLQISKNFERTFIAEVDFLDVNDNVTYSPDIVIIQENQDIVEVEPIAIVSQTPEILNTVKLRVTIRLTPGTNTIDPDIAKKFKFKSAGLFYLRL
jgi:hypothetical protein